jgi:DNA repair exonuclease SbcCD ATPase subunit
VTRRTIADAQRSLTEDHAPRLTDYNLQRARQLIEAAQRDARDYASRRIDTIEEEVQETYDEAARALTEARDGFEDLERESRSGRISADDYARRLAELREQQVEAEAALSRAEEIVGEVESIEEDPIRWYDEEATRFPNARLLKDFPW